MKQLKGEMHPKYHVKDQGEYRVQEGTFTEVDVFTLEFSCVCATQSM